MVLPLVGEYVAAFFEPLHNREGVFYFFPALLWLNLKKILKLEIYLTRVCQHSQLLYIPDCYQCRVCQHESQPSRIDIPDEEKLPPTNNTVNGFGFHFNSG